MPFPPNLLWSLKVNSSQVKHYGSGNGTTPGDISDPFPPSVQGISDKSSPVLLCTLSSQCFSSHERILKDNSEVRGSDERDGKKEQKAIHGTIWVWELVTVGFKARLCLFLVPRHDQSLMFLLQLQG